MVLHYDRCAGVPLLLPGVTLEMGNVLLAGIDVFGPASEFAPTDAIVYGAGNIMPQAPGRARTPRQPLPGSGRP
jgi:hypothetical protein